MLEIKNLKKKYSSNDYYSVDDLCLSVKDGEIFGFLGQNGAGKSTTIKCITGIIPFDEGSIEICGFDVNKNPIDAKQNIGYVCDEQTTCENLTGREYVNFIANIYGVDKDIVEKRCEEYVPRLGMTKVFDKLIRTYSFGLKQKINIIAVLVHEPKFWILDEPIIGLDPESAFEIKEIMKEYKNRGNTVFFSSHYISMVEQICDRIAIIKKGKLLEVINMREFLETHTEGLENYYLKVIKSN